MDNTPVFPGAVDKARAHNINPLVLAFIGDSVHTLFVRSRLALASDKKTAALHREASAEISAVHQSAALEALKPLLTEEEEAIYRRARNSKLNTAAKHAELLEYRRATGLEAVIGYLYITGQNERLKFILELISAPAANDSEPKK
ncbi:MAG TPA: ribonuclease III domain-containing protein [Eubacteriales bacterium]|jgi:ribonuclease-3 family protein|nr:ribonuclease III domain-containing protein [Clostridia bacterium]HRR89247.1 ribonuclease III domain-containing protein [Eubacteriales bacterium]HRU84679.1 ribonuclease III domain-containing protein [Eubacteriales bacterium]